MKPIINSVNSILFKVFKKHNPIFAELLVNWGKIAGIKLSSNSCPLRIQSSWEKGNKVNILYIKANNSSVSMEISYQQDIIIERIAVYFGHKAIHKVRITL